MASDTGGSRALYAVLQVAANATGDEIKAAYRRLALQHHPDRRRGDADTAEDENATFARIALAYEVLGQSQRRKRYDLSGELPQSDAALGRAAGETFLSEYLTSAPATARSVTNKDMSLHSLDNYEVLDVHGKDVPEYMRGIVMIGLGYLVGVVDNMEEKEVVLLRHFVMDQMYALIAYVPPLDDEAFSERGYVITYYDHPLQSGIKPSWSDQNTLGSNRCQKDQAKLKEIDEVTIERRKLAALEWFGLPSAKPEITQPPLAIAGEGVGPERLQLAARAFVKAEQDPMSFDIHRVRRAFEILLGVEAHALDLHSAMGLMNLILEAMEDDEEDPPEPPETQVGNDSSATNMPSKTTSASITSACTLGSRVVISGTGRIGEVALHDPTDADLAYKVIFTDGHSPDADWFSAAAVSPAP